MRKRGIIELGSKIPIEVRINNFFVQAQDLPDYYYIGKFFWESASQPDKDVILQALSKYDMNQHSTFTKLFIARLIEDIKVILTERQQSQNDKIIHIDFRPK